MKKVETLYGLGRVPLYYKGQAGWVPGLWVRTHIDPELGPFINRDLILVSDPDPFINWNLTEVPNPVFYG